jgi:hypothetical protein
VTRALLDLLERIHPGFGDLVEYSELGTPLTFEHFTAAPSGTIYGYPGTPEKYSQEKTGAPHREVGRKSVAWRAKPLRSSLYKRFSGASKTAQNAPPRSKKQALSGALASNRRAGCYK